jgi:hypothetical protein
MMSHTHRGLCGILAIALLVGQWAAVAAQEPKQVSLMQSEAFKRSFMAKYTRLQGLTSEVILLDLTETLEEVLISKSHVSTVGLDYKIQQLKKRLFGKLREQICTADSSSAVPEDLVKSGTVRSLVSLSAEEQWKLTDDQFGTLTGILVRIIQVGTLRSFCSSQSFNQLAR